MNIKLYMKKGEDIRDFYGDANRIELCNEIVKYPEGYLTEYQILISFGIDHEDIVADTKNIIELVWFDIEERNKAWFIAVDEEGIKRWSYEKN